jgi:hypothetical protein
LLCSQNDDADRRFRGFLIFGPFAFDEDYAARYGRVIRRRPRSSKLRSTERLGLGAWAAHRRFGELGPFATAKRRTALFGTSTGAAAFCDGLVRMHTIRGWIVRRGDSAMDSIIYLVGLIVVVMFILSVLGLH